MPRVFPVRDLGRQAAHWFQTEYELPGLEPFARFGLPWPYAARIGPDQSLARDALAAFFSEGEGTC